MGAREEVKGAEEYRSEARRLISTGHPTRAFELLREGLEAHGEDAEMRYLQALALARGGNASKGTEIAAGLLKRKLPGAVRVEVLSLLGRLWKDRYVKSRDVEMARESLRHYGRAYKLTGDPFPGINAASMSSVLGRTAEAKRLASEVARTVEATGGAKKDHWRMATLGEAALLRGDIEGAGRWYREAVAAAGERVGDVAAMRRNVMLLRESAGVDREMLSLFDVGAVVAFAGHLVDRPGVAPARFPDDGALDRSVALAIRAKLEAMDARIGYSSAACGADLLFAEEMLRRGGELHLVLPFSLDDFYASSVDYGLQSMSRWRRRFDDVVRRASEVHYATTEGYLGDQVLFDFANRFIQGLAVTRAEQLGAATRALVVMEPGATEVVGGTASFLRHWRDGGREGEVIDLRALRTSLRGDPRSRSPVRGPASRRRPGEGRRTVRFMLFADVKNFSKLQEEQAPAFVAMFQREVDRVLRASRRKPAFQNTWGDGLFFVFDEVEHAADFALRLLERIGGVDFAALDLPADTTVRIGVHAGPVYSYSDRIIGRASFFGSHVNRAARIEPVTTPGCVFASEQFAALLAVSGTNKFECQYVGIEELAKRYGKCALYRLGRR